VDFFETQCRTLAILSVRRQPKMYSVSITVCEIGHLGQSGQ